MDLIMFVAMIVVVLIQVDESYIYYFWLWISPLLLELSPCGQV